MDNRKRIRLAGGGGVAGAATNTSSVPINGIHGVSLNAGIGGGAATMLSIAGGGHSYYLTSASETLELPANVFLTICGDDEDDNSDDASQEFLIETTTTTTTCHNEQQTHIIKQEPTTTATATTNAIPNVQYRLVNPRKLQKSTPTQSQPPPLISTTAATTTTGSAAILPTSLQLPSGCEIYLVKEYVDNNNTPPLMNATTRPSTVLSGEAAHPLAAAIKLEPNLCLTPARPALTGQPQLERRTAINVPRLVATSTKLPPEPRTMKATPATTTAGGDDMKLNKRSYILEAYKKRDDKRRATHNEVERRRRDKINSWIFKLKEMLPSELATASHEAAAATAASLCPQQQPARKLCDSKSQILIKACEYIKAMQDELKNLRECLTANEHETQRLQTELNLYKTTQIASSNGNSHSNNNGKPSNSCSPTATITMSSSSPSPSTHSGNFMLGGHMNATSFYSLVDPSSSPPSIGALKDADDDEMAVVQERVDGGDTFATNFTTKRELIITDYVD